MKTPTLLLAAAVASLVAAASPAAAVAAVQVVTTLPSYASIAQLVGGDRVEAQSISRGDEDPHFVKPKPSYALMLKKADLFVTTGLDLELWGPVLLDKAGNPKIMEGQPGYVAAHQGVPLLEVPSSTSRAGGDIHAFGNPHIYTSPLNAKIIAADIAAGLKRVDPAGAATYDTNLKTFQNRIDEAMYGKELVTMLGSATLDPLARQGKLIDFLKGKTYQGKPLLDHLGGWMKQGLVFRGQKVVTYHRSWTYFADLFGMQIADFVEPKPGIPPSAKHVMELIDEIQGQKIKVLVAESYYDPKEPQAIAARTGCKALMLPVGPGGGGPADYFALVDFWVGSIARAFQA